MNWISVKDQLPERYKEVFIYPRPEDCGTQYVAQYGLLKGYEEPVWYYEHYEHHWGWESIKIDVTHWTYIPEDPEDE